MIKLRRISISHFRSIENLALDIPLQQKRNYFVFVGQNNAGKTNILDALHLLFQKNTANLQQEDFFNHETETPIVLEALFWKPIIYKPFATSPHTVEVHGIRRERKIARKGEAKGQMIWVQSCLKHDGAVQSRPRSVPKKNAKLAFELMFDIPDAVWDEINCVYLDSERYLDDHMPSRRRGFLNKVVQKVNADFQVAAPEPPETRTPMDLFMENMASLLALLRTKPYTDLEDTLNIVLKHFFEKNVVASFGTISSMDCYEAMNLAFKEGELDVSIGRAGEGARSILLLSIMFAYHRIMNEDSIFLLEEPELFLHPYRQRQMEHYIVKHLANANNYAFVSTHSPEFIELDNLRNIYRVFHDDSTKIASVTDALEPKDVKHLRLSIGRELSGIFFASIVLLVEGESDWRAIPAYAERMDRNLERKNICIIHARGKANIKRLYGIIRSLGIAVAICYDRDRNDDMASNALDALAKSDAGCFVVGLEPNYEDEVKAISGKSNEEWDVYYVRLGHNKPSRASALAMSEELDIPEKLRLLIDALWNYSESGNWAGRIIFGDVH